MRKKDSKARQRHLELLDWLKANRIAQLLLAVALIYLFLQWQKMDEIHGFFWLSRPHADELYLTSYPKLASGMLPFSVYSTSALSCRACGSPIHLAEGSNAVAVNPSSCAGGTMLLDCGGKNLSFAFANAQSLPPEAVYAAVAPALHDRHLNLLISGSGTMNGYLPLEILVDGSIAASPLHMLNGSFSFTESVPVPSGEHSYEVRYGGQALATGIFSQPSAFSLPALLTIILCAALAIAWKGDAAGRLLAFIPLLTACLVIEFRLAQADAAFTVPAVLAGTLLYCLCCAPKAGPHKEGAAAAEPHSRLAKEAIIFGVAFALFILLTNILIYTYDLWGAYYFRHAQMTFEQGTSGYFDALSYLGRQSTYPPVFFEFAAEFTRAFGFFAQSYEDVRVPLNLLLTLAYGASSYLVFRRFSFAQRVVAASLMVTLWGTLMTASGIGLHMIAFTLMNCAVALLPSSLPFAAASLGLAFAAHPLALVFYPFLAFAANGFKLQRKFIASAVFVAVAAILLSLPFYLPIFMRSGLPYEIVPEQWGYLLSYGIDGIRFSLNFLFPFALATIAVSLWRRTHVLPSLFLLLLILMTAFVSLRLDMAVAITLAGLAPAVFEKELAGRRFLLLFVLAYLLPNLALGAVVMNGTSYYCAWGLSNDVCSSPMKYLNSYSPSESTVALNPLYAHLETYVGKRPVLADLYVEYADYGKFKAEDDFYNQGDESGLQKYGITYAVVDDFPHPRTSSGDRVYDNGYIHAFRRA